MNHEPQLKPGECVIEDYGNQVLIGPCPVNQSAAVPTGLGLFLIVVAVIAYQAVSPEIDHRRQQYQRLIRQAREAL